MLVNGKQIATQCRASMREQIEQLKLKIGRVPSLVVILVGEDPASQSYVRGKIKACAEVGIKSTLITKADTISQQELLTIIADLNKDSEVDGILVQLPLPKHINEYKIICAIEPKKDVDGFHPFNVAALWQGEKCIVPCTPKGVMKMLKMIGVDVAGKHAVVIGRSNIVGKPMAKLLLDADATVTIAHSKTTSLKQFTLSADILVSATGCPHLITKDMIKPGAVVIDIGIRKDPTTGKLVGDVESDCEEVASYITPVPGGVGPMTITMLMQNTIDVVVNE